MALDGKTAIVTGAAMGIGKAVTEILLKNGAKVAVLDVNKVEGENLVKDLNKEYGADRALFLSCNVESDEEFKAAFQKAAEAFGAIDILCNNAGVLNEEKWQDMISVNLAGVIRGTYLALEHMRKTNGGRGGVIVNIASMAGLLPLLTCPVYTATKHGVIGFTRAVAAASAASNYGIRVNALCPAFVETELFTAFKHKLGQFAHLKDVADQLMKKVRVLNAPEVAECILELVTDETKNGEAFMVRAEMKGYVPLPSLSSTDKP